MDVAALLELMSIPELNALLADVERRLAERQAEQVTAIGRARSIPFAAPTDPGTAARLTDPAG